MKIQKIIRLIVILSFIHLIMASDFIRCVRQLKREYDSSDMNNINDLENISDILQSCMDILSEYSNEKLEYLVERNIQEYKELYWIALNITNELHNHVLRKKKLYNIRDDL
jgi:hypothetical protein